MNTSANKKQNIGSDDPIDFMIFEKGLRIKTLFIEKDLDMLLIILNNGNLIKLRISAFDKLMEADQEALSDWKLINDGVGISWSRLDEDLSLRGFIKEATFQATLDQFLRKGPSVIVA
jgi:hypothetical protein